jgi:hypothetical protein
MEFPIIYRIGKEWGKISVKVKRKGKDPRKRKATIDASISLGRSQLEQLDA